MNIYGELGRNGEVTVMTFFKMLSELVKVANMFDRNKHAVSLTHTHLSVNLGSDQ